MMTGTIVHRISIGVLWVVREGEGLVRALKRTMTIRRSESTNAEIAAMIHNRKKWKLATSSMTGVAESCRSICQKVGWPSPAHALPMHAIVKPAPAATIKRHPLRRALSRGAMSLAGLAAIREFRPLQTTNRGLLQCTHDPMNTSRLPGDKVAGANGSRPPWRSHNGLTLWSLDTAGSPCRQGTVAGSHCVIRAHPPGAT